MSARNWVILNLLGLLWGASFLFYKVLVTALPPITVVLGRVAIAAVALNIYLAMRGQTLPRGKRLWARLAMLALLNNVLPFILLAWGETRITSGLASILNATIPFFVIPIAHVMTPDEKFTVANLRGVPGAYAVYVVGASMEPRYHPGELVHIHPGKPLTVGAYVLVQRRASDGDTPRAVIKRLVKRTATKIVLEQFNPHKTFEIRNDDIVSVHRVVGSGEA